MVNNEEILNVVKIMGLKYGQKYDDEKALKSLRYGHIMIMTDQDQDGSHIKGLVINFIHHNWPSLIKTNVLEEFITPIVKVCDLYDCLSACVKCDRACENRSCEHKKSLTFSVFAVSQLSNYLYYCNKIFNTTAEFNMLSSAAYRNGVAHSE